MLASLIARHVALAIQCLDRLYLNAYVLKLMGPHLDRRAATGQSGAAAIGVAQEFQRAWTAYERQTSTGAVQ